MGSVESTWVTDLGLSPDAWLLVTMLACLSFFFKVGRFWSLRNLDLVLVFAPTPGLMLLTGNDPTKTWLAFVWLFVGSLLLIIRCVVDLGIPRRPVLEPNLNASGMACLLVGILGLFVVEMITRPTSRVISALAGPNPSRLEDDDWPTSDPEVRTDPIQIPAEPDTTTEVVGQAIVRRGFAMVAQIGIVVTLVLVGWRLFERPEAGLSAATCYLLLPYSRFGLVDCAQLLPSALIVLSVLNHQRSGWTGTFLGLAAGWMPACLGLLPLWAGYYDRRGFLKFMSTGLASLGCSALVLCYLPSSGSWLRAIGVRTWGNAGLWPSAPNPLGPSFWTGIDPSYRLPVLVGYAIFVIVLAIFPLRKNLGEIIALSGALLAASQFWYLEAGGTLILLYLPLLILMMFRPNLVGRAGSKRLARPRSPSSAST